MEFKLFLLLILNLSACRGRKIRLLADGPAEPCDPKAPKDYTYIVDLEYLTENDEAYLNGNCTWTQDINVWKMNFWTEKKVGASWYRAPIQGSNVDLCKSIVDKMDFFYPFMKSFHPCPYKKGEWMEFSMKKFEFDDFEVPEKLEGEWALYIDFFFSNKAGSKKECWVKRGEISHW